jgi:hypothetical protein
MSRMLCMSCSFDGRCVVALGKHWSHLFPFKNPVLVRDSEWKGAQYARRSIFQKDRLGMSYIRFFFFDVCTVVFQADARPSGTSERRSFI